MLHYYVYYNIGGYKDLYLGSSEDTFEATYFLPLLSIWKESDDERQRKRAEEYASLPPVYDLNDQFVSIPEGIKYPEGANDLIIHGGYKVFFKYLDEENYALSIAGIDSVDDMNRPSPFLFMVTGNKVDLPRMFCFANYVINNLSGAKSFLLDCVSFDNVHNGIKCKLKEINDKFERLLKDNPNCLVNIAGENYQFMLKDGHHPLILIPGGFSLSFVMEQQRIPKNQKISIVLEIRDGGEMCLKHCSLPKAVSYEFTDGDGNVLFTTAEEDDALFVGKTKASPDGVFTIADGRTITIEDGFVTAIVEPDSGSGTGGGGESREDFWKKILLSKIKEILTRYRKELIIFLMGLIVGLLLGGAANSCSNKSTTGKEVIEQIQ